MIAAVLSIFVGATSTADFDLTDRERLRSMSYSPVTLAVRRPLLTLQTCMAIADRSEEELTRCIEEGRIRVCFDISHRESRHRRALRVLATSLAEYLKHPDSLRAETPGQIEAEVAALFPSLTPTLRTETAARLLGCCDYQIGQLIRADAFKVTRKGGCGPGNATLIERQSVIDWLLSRRIT